MKAELSTVPIDEIGKSILLIRGQRVMLNRNLADPYGDKKKRREIPERFHVPVGPRGIFKIEIPIRNTKMAKNREFFYAWTGPEYDYYRRYQIVFFAGGASASVQEEIRQLPAPPGKPERPMGLQIRDTLTPYPTRKTKRRFNRSFS